MAAFTPTVLLYTMITFSFFVVTFFMFKPKGEEKIHKIFFCLGVALAFFATLISATSLPSELTNQIIATWCGLVFAALGVVLRAISVKTKTIANTLVIVSIIYAVATYFLLA